MCSPALLRDRARTLKKPADLARHVLLHYDDPAGQWPWLSWSQWLDAFHLGELKPAGIARYSHYDQLIQAAIEGEGVALGRTPLVMRFLKSGALVAPFKDRVAGTREYFIIVSPHAAARPQVEAFRVLAAAGNPPRAVMRQAALRLEPRLGHIHREHRIHRHRMLREPLGERLRERAAELRVARRHAFAHFERGFEYLFVLAPVAAERRKLQRSPSTALPARNALRCAR